MFGTPPVGVIGKHKPREIVRVERDYSVGELCQFWSGWIWELEGRVSFFGFVSSSVLSFFLFVGWFGGRMLLFGLVWGDWDDSWD